MSILNPPTHRVLDLSRNGAIGMLEVRLLGQFDVRVDGKPIEIPSRPAQSLLAYLLVHTGVKHRREKLAGEIWRDVDESNARSNLRHALWRLGRALGTRPQSEQKYFVADSVSIAFDTDTPHWLDVAALDAKEGGAPSTEQLMDTVAVYRGEFLPGFYDDWITDVREHLLVVFERKMEKLLGRLVAEQRWADVLEHGEQWIALGSTPEPAYRALLIAHSRLGDMSSVATVYQRCLEALDKKLGVKPSEQTLALYQQLLKGEKLPEAVGKPKPRESAPELPRVTPSPAVLAAPPARPVHNLPQQPTPFIGRVEELAEIARRIADPTCRLLTLIGPGGIGKTRLAVQAACAAVEAFRDGVYFVSLAPITSTEFIMPALADALKFSFYSQEKPGLQLLNYLREKQMLLLMDNFEHLIEGIGLLDDILTTAPGVKILVTSRERLHLQWEWLLEVEGLAFPEHDAVEAVADYGAVQLFAQTARRLQPRFSLAAEKLAVARICRQARGMPLAIELAAVLVRALSCQEIADEIERTLDMLATTLRDVPARHRSIRAAFEYSWNLLSAHERDALLKLSVFQGGFQREAAAQVAAAPLAVLLSLVDKSFVSRNAAGRYEIHELLRQYVAEKVTAASDDVHARMAQYYLSYALAHRHDYAALEPEWGNLAASMRTAYQRQLWQIVIDFSNALTESWIARARYTDARQNYALACEAARALNDRQSLATSLRRWGRANIEQGYYAEAETLLSQSLELCERLGDQSGLANAQYELARVAIEKSNYDEAQRLLEQSRQLQEELGDMLGLARTLYLQARIQYRFRDYVETERIGKLALYIQQKLPSNHACIPTLRLLAVNASRRGHHDLAEQYGQQAIALSEEVQDKGEQAAALYNMSIVFGLRGNFEFARDYAERSLALNRLIGDRKAQASVLHQLSKVELNLKGYESAKQQALLSLSLYQELQDALGMAGVLLNLGDILKSVEQGEQAKQRWSEALSIAERLQHPLAKELQARLGQDY